MRAAFLFGGMFPCLYIFPSNNDLTVVGEQLRQTVKQGEQLLAGIQAALSNIHTAQLEMQRIAAEEFIQAYTGASTL